MSDDQPIERHYLPALDEAQTAAVWQRIAARRWPAVRARRSRVIVGASAAAMALATAMVIAVIAWPTARPEPLASRGGAVSAAPGTVWTSADHAVVLDDDSTVALATDARLQVLANEGTRFATLLEAGSARFDVHPGGPRRWEIETALASVEVVGTAFTVALHEGQLAVDVERGVVLVHGELVPGRVVRLTAGQRIVVGPAQLVPTVAAAPVPVPVPAPAPVVAEEPRPRSARPDARPPHPAVSAAAPPAKSIADVIAEADQLTSSGDAAGAARLLEQARTRGNDHEVGLVAFALGRLYLDALAQPELAAAAFDDVIARGNPHSLVEDAYARRAEAWIRAGQRARAVTALAAYDQTYPHGRRSAALHALLLKSP